MYSHMGIAKLSSLKTWKTLVCSWFAIWVRLFTVYWFQGRRCLWTFYTARNVGIFFERLDYSLRMHSSMGISTSTPFKIRRKRLVCLWIMNYITLILDWWRRGDDFSVVQQQSSKPYFHRRPNMPMRKVDRPCYFWLENKCTRGDSCWYTHDLEVFFQLRLFIVPSW